MRFNVIFCPNPRLRFFLKFSYHCKKSVRIRNFYGPYFLAIRLNMEIYRVNIYIQSECRKMRGRKVPNTEHFHVVSFTCFIYWNEWPWIWNLTVKKTEKRFMQKSYSRILYRKMKKQSKFFVCKLKSGLLFVLRIFLLFSHQWTYLFLQS